MKTEEKRAYESPTLIEYGAVRDLTAGGSGTMSEIKGGDMCLFPTKLTYQYC